MPAEWQERRAAGRALRQDVPRSAHAEWSPHPDRADPVEVLAAQGESRVAELLPVRYARMAESAFAFFRGSAAIMAADLATGPVTGLQVEACGDAHVGNFGKFATPGRSLIFDINDFDETLPGPWEWDVKRLAASMHIVGRQRAFGRATCDRIVEAAVRAYREHMAEAAALRTLDLWYARTHIRDVIAHFPPKYRARVERDVAKARRKNQRRAVAKLTHGAGDDIRFVEDPPLVVHLANTDGELDAIDPMIELYRETLSSEIRNLFDRFRILDVARKVVGVGSVGTRCWICLFEGPDRPEGDHVILQVKQAQASVLEPYAGASAYPHHGQRVVAGQRLTQAASDIFLGWTEAPISKRQYYVRQLWDFKGSSDPLTMELKDLTYYGALCGMALARAHARTGDPVQIAAYLGRSDTFDRAVAAWSAQYAITNDEDHARLLEAIKSGRVEAHPDS